MRHYKANAAHERKLAVYQFRSRYWVRLTFHHSIVYSCHAWLYSRVEIDRIEGWHRRLQAAVSAHHPNIWKFIKVLKREQSLVDVEVNQALGGHQQALQRRQYAAFNTRIVTLVRDYGNRHVLDYLHGIGHNLSF